MTKTLKVLEQIFNILTFTYPKNYREEFGTERLSVFSEILQDATEHSRWAMAQVVLRELKDYPTTMMRAHWQTYLNKELSMVSTMPIIAENGCSRCGMIKEAEARYCPSCGMAFISSRDHLHERWMNFVNDTLTLRIVGGIFLIVFPFIAANAILLYGYHPATNWTVLSGSILISVILGWRLYGQTPNFEKLRFLLILALVAIAFFEVASRVDTLLLRSTLDIGDSLSYEFLGSETYVAYVSQKETFDTEDHISMPGHTSLRMYRYFPKAGTPSREHTGLPALLIERVWFDRDLSGTMLIFLIGGCVATGFYGTKKYIEKHTPSLA